MQETQRVLVQSLGKEDPVEKETATCCSILAWRIPWTEEPRRLQSMESQTAGHEFEWLNRAHRSWYRSKVYHIFSGINLGGLLIMLLLSHFSRVRLCATPWTAALQAPLSMRFSRQEDWSGLSFPSPGIFLTQRVNPHLLHRWVGSLPLSQS